MYRVNVPVNHGSGNMGKITPPTSDIRPLSCFRTVWKGGIKRHVANVSSAAGFSAFLEPASRGCGKLQVAVM